MLLSFILSGLLFLSLFFPNSAHQKVFFSLFQKKSFRAPASSNKAITFEQEDSSQSKEKTLWKNVSPFKTEKLSLYQWENNENILISIKKAKGYSIKKISDLPAFLKQVEGEKLVTLSKTSIKDRKVLHSQAKNTDNTALLYTKGTYLDFQDDTVFFEDLSFYHGKISLHILIHNTQEYTKEEIQAIYSFLEGIVLSENSLDINDQKEFISLTEQIKNEKS